MDGETIVCAQHGEVPPAYVCSHLLGDSVGLGFFRNDPTDENPFPDAWCGDCEIIRETQGGWNEESEKHIKISLICANCYQAARIRNTRPEVTLDDLRDLRWKCGACDEWHFGPIFDIGFEKPDYWRDEYRGKEDSYLSKDFCVIENRDYFVRGAIHLPILGSNETFRWGVWGSLSEANFRKMNEVWDDPEYANLPPMFSWLSSKIPEYPDTLNLKMDTQIASQNDRPRFILEKSAHPLSQEFRDEITPSRIKEIMMMRLGGAQE